MNEPGFALMQAALERVRPLTADLIDHGWRPELVVLAPGELERIPAVVVPLDSVPELEA